MYQAPSRPFLSSKVLTPWRHGPRSTTDESGGTLNGRREVERRQMAHTQSCNNVHGAFQTCSDV